MAVSWIGASIVAQKRVPMLTPSAPSASAANGLDHLREAAAIASAKPGRGIDRLRDFLIR